MSNSKLIGLTIAESIDQIKRIEKGRFFQYYIVIKESKTFNYFKADKRVHYYNEKGERVYRIVETESLIYAKNKELENNSFVIDSKIEKGTADNWSFNGYISTSTHNIYYLFVDHLQKGNKGAKELLKKTKKLITYKENELTRKQHRITL